MSKLAQIKAASATSPQSSRLGDRLGSNVRGMEREVHGLGRVFIQLVGHNDTQRIEAETFAAMRELNIELSEVTALTFEAERAVRTLAIAFRDPDDHAKPFGTLEEWVGLADSDLISVAWQRYGDVREELLPVPAVLDEKTARIIATAIEKKNMMLLQSCGVQSLCVCLLTTEGQQLIYSTLKSLHGDTSSASS